MGNCYFKTTLRQGTRPTLNHTFNVCFEAVAPKRLALIRGFPDLSYDLRTIGDSVSIESESFGLFVSLEKVLQEAPA
jgi:hypothetical protein